MVVIGTELAVGVLAGIVFIAAYWRAPWGKSPAGRHMMAVTAVMAGELATLLLLLLGVRVPLWVFVAGYAVMDLVMLHRLWLLRQARRVS